VLNKQKNSTTCSTHFVTKQDKETQGLLKTSISRKEGTGKKTSTIKKSTSMLVFRLALTTNHH